MLDVYPEIQRGLVDIQNRYPALSESDIENLQAGLGQLRAMEYTVEVSGEDMALETISQFNQRLSGMQEILTDLESKLQQSI